MLKKENGMCYKKTPFHLYDSVAVKLTYAGVTIGFLAGWIVRQVVYVKYFILVFAGIVVPILATGQNTFPGEEMEGNASEISTVYEYEREGDQERQYQQILRYERLKLRRQIVLTKICLASAVLFFVLALVIFRLYLSERRTSMTLRRRNDEILLREAKLGAMNRTREKLLSVLSHDLKNPLLGLEVSIRMFLEGAVSSERLYKYIGDLRVRLQSTSGFVDNILNWTKGQFAGIRPRKSFFQAKVMLEEIMNLLEPAAQAKQVLVIPVISSEFDLYGDYEMTMVVLRNLITNAIKFSPRGECVTVSVGHKSDQIIISVHDNGAGIRKDCTEIFSLAGHPEKGTNGEIGNGLGLLLSREFTEKQGGRLWFESNKNLGTTFYFTLPLQMPTCVLVAQ